MNPSLDSARRWAAIDPDPVTSAEMTALIDGDPTEAAHRMETPLSFGTAGIRGPLGAGPSRMNRLVVRQLAAGLAQVLTDNALTAHVSRGEPDAVDPLIVVGRDARHGSTEFAADVVGVLATAGLRVVDAGIVPTPVVAWAVRDLAATAGLVVTASHNPSTDNGVKVYWSDGAQIIPPVDQLIARAVDEHRDRCPPVDDLAVAARVENLGASLVDRYVEHAIALVDSVTGCGDQPATGLRVATTSLHGVGGDLLARILGRLGADLHPVAAQHDPDPDFPTVTYPNPEEPGATDALRALARDVDADLAIANDPDADRLAVLVGPGWRQLRGDELGAVLIEGLADRLPPNRRGLVASTVVSSQLAGVVANARGLVHIETLTGFKWLARPALEHPDLTPVLAYEEALGYAVGDQRDKDGLTAAAVVVALVARWRHEGLNITDVLDRIAATHGLFVQRNFSVRLDEAAAGSGTPGFDASGLDASAIERVVPAVGERFAGEVIERVDRPAADVTRAWLERGDRIVVRPSGTEPKVKCYCEVVIDVAEGYGDAAAATARRRLDIIENALRDRIARG